jgi:AcrR family transcriptional regulator
LEVVSAPYSLPIPFAQLRREPVQRRAVEAVEAILDATIDLLETVGYEGLTTALVAERAGVNIATVYRYFTDKASLVRVLTERHLLDNRMTSVLGSRLDAEGVDWREFMHRRFRQVASHVEIRQNLNALYRALQADPALKSVSLSWPVERARLLGRHLQASRPHLTDERAFAAGVMIVLGSVSVLVRLDRRPERAAAIVAELAAAMEIFISGL